MQRNALYILSANRQSQRDATCKDNQSPFNVLTIINLNVLIQQDRLVLRPVYRRVQEGYAPRCANSLPGGILDPYLQILLRLDSFNALND